MTSEPIVPPVSDRNWRLRYSWVRDMAERAVWTFLQTLLTLVLADDVLQNLLVQGRLNITVVTKLVLSALAATLSVVKSSIARSVGPPDAALPSPVNEPS